MNKFSNILNEIRFKRQQYYRKHGRPGGVICLNIQDEVRLAAFFIYNAYAGTPTDFSDVVEKILKEGIRNLNLRIFGMALEFDCASLHIRSN